MPDSRPSRLRVVLAFAAVYVIWGSTYLGIRYAIETLPPFLMAGTRFLLAGTILFSLAGLNGERLRTSFSQWPKAFIIGALLLLVGNGGVTWAEKYIATSLAALFVATEPFWVVLLNSIISRSRPKPPVMLGVLIGLVGVGLLVSDGLSAAEAGSWLSLAGSGVVLVSSFAWAAGSVYANHRPIKGSTSMAAGMQMMAGGSLLLLLGVVAGELPRLSTMSPSWLSIGAFFYLLVFGSLVGFTAYSWLLRNVTPARAATYAYVNPVVAVLLGWLLANEPLTSRMLIAAAVIVGSVVLITTFGREHTTTTAAPNAVHDSDCPTPPCA
ncbi:MAG TPA: EamA family transporter [Pyrinomonadaceae bacterium]|nr:EamA family transporter [Pyrinomonadaceae bacterium]